MRLTRYTVIRDLNEALIDRRLFRHAADMPVSAGAAFRPDPAGTADRVYAGLESTGSYSQRQKPFGCDAEMPHAQYHVCVMIVFLYFCV